MTKAETFIARVNAHVNVWGTMSRAEWEAKARQFDPACEFHVVVQAMAEYVVATFSDGSRAETGLSS